MVEESDRADNYRAKILGGLLGQLIFQAANSYWTTSYRQVEIHCDNEGVVLHGNTTERALKEKKV